MCQGQGGCVICKKKKKNEGRVGNTKSLDYFGLLQVFIKDLNSEDKRPKAEVSLRM